MSLTKATHRVLADSSVGTAQLSAGAVTTDKIALSAVTAEKINLTTNLSLNGYQILPNGLIIQWGTVTTPGGGVANNVAATFSIPFPNQALSLSLAGGGLATNDRVGYEDLTSTGVTINVADTNGAVVQSATVKYIVLGY